MYRFHRWFDRLPPGRRFVTFMAMMAVLVYWPSVLWLFHRFDTFFIGPLELAGMLPVLASRMLYVRRRRREQIWSV